MNNHDIVVWRPTEGGSTAFAHCSCGHDWSIDLDVSPEYDPHRNPPHAPTCPRHFTMTTKAAQPQETP